MISVKNLIGMSLYSLERGILPQRVKDIIYEPRINRIVAYIAEEENTDLVYILPFDFVGAIGKNSLIIGSSQPLRGQEDMSLGETMFINGDLSLWDKLVLTKKGVEAGRISDLYFNPETGEGEALEIHNHHDLESLLNGRKFLKVSAISKIGKRVVIISDIQKYDQSSVEFINRKIRSVNEYQQNVYSETKN